MNLGRLSFVPALPTYWAIGSAVSPCFWYSSVIKLVVFSIWVVQEIISLEIAYSSLCPFTLCFADRILQDQQPIPEQISFQLWNYSLCCETEVENPTSRFLPQREAPPRPQLLQFADAVASSLPPPAANAASSPPTPAAVLVGTEGSMPFWLLNGLPVRAETRWQHRGKAGDGNACPSRHQWLLTSPSA